jgi:Flp pilus assembly protein TadD/tRNA A-37 threonylcarbamoyl transferase component Bud32
MADTTPVNELLLRWQELRDQGRAVSAEGLCAGRPDLLDDLRRQIEALRSMEQFLGTTGGGPPLPTDPEAPSIPLGEETAATAAGEGPLVGSRYRPLRLHARGGLGEVYLARDEELSREVALKRMRRPHAADACHRFLREGEITGSLEHPGVVPVYGLTRDADGQPCYAMRFIRGQTLQEAIARFQEADEAGRSLALRHLLGRFVAVCNTIAYAHSRGVVHRDLKPANIMLGDYGETLVVDWGLAKRLGHAGEAQSPDDGAPGAPRDGRGDGTAPGDVLGTPAFMSPEQATGRHDAVGPASDIYGLGATLYALLRGQPPFAGDSVAEVLRQVERGDFPPPRQLRRDTPRALEAICLKAMAREPAARYATALELAADLERWLADEPVRAYPEPVRLRLARWARRHRTVLASAAVLAVIVGILGGLGAWWLDRQHVERRRGVEAALAEVSGLQRRAKWDVAEAVLKQAQDRLTDHGPADLQRALEQARRDLDLVARLEAVALRRGTVVDGKLGQLDDAGADQGYAAVFAEVGPGTPTDDPQTVADWLATSSVRAPLLGALDDWADCVEDKSRRNWILTVTQRADPDRWRDRARLAVSQRDPLALGRLAAEDAAVEQPPQLAATVAHRLGRQGIDLLRRAQALHPEDFWLTFRLGLALHPINAAEAAEYYRAALALRPGTTAVLNNLGNILRDQRRLDEAKVMYQQACTVDPTQAPVHNGLGNVLLNQGHLEEAKEEFHRALALNSGFAAAHNGLGAALHDQRRLKEAEVEYRRACDLDPKLAPYHHNLGSVLFDLRRFEEAETAFRHACKLDSKLALPHHNLGVLLGAKNRLEEAKAEFLRACELDPNKAASHNYLGRVYLAQNRLEDAAKEYRRACDLDTKFANHHNGLGNALRALGQLDEAKAEYHRACGLDVRYAEPHGNLGQILQEEGRLEEALAEYHQASQLGFAAVRPPLHDCEQQIALRKRLPGLASGQDRPADQAERLAFAALCQLPSEGRYALAARLYTAAFAADSKLADHRYDAACAASLAGCGQGKDSGTLDDHQKARLRQQALAWLNADLLRWCERLKSDKPPDRSLVQQRLRRWQQDTALAGLRDPAALVKLPEAEWQSCLKLWADVDALLRRVEGAAN